MLMIDKKFLVTGIVTGLAVAVLSRFLFKGEK